VRSHCVFKLPFGEELSSGLGLRSSTPGYATSDTNRWKYGMLQRDAATGLDHSWFRKYESSSGRWTSPDPIQGGDPQSQNKYAYAGNDPVNFVDPSGLCTFSNFLDAKTKGADYNLTVIATAPSSVPSTWAGSTDLTSTRAVDSKGRIWVNRLQKFSTNTTAGRILFPLSDNFLGFALGTAAAHEIAHYLLQQNFDRPFSGIMKDDMNGVEWFGAIRTFNPAQIMILNRRCAPVTTDTTVPNTSLGSGWWADDR
jgi:RHS repeat-associated protein